MSDFALPLLSGWLDVVDGGTYKIWGTAKRLGAPVRRRIRLFERRSGRLIRETWSRESDGYYEFLNIAYRERGYTVVEYDNANELTPLNADIKDLVTPAPMGSTL